ncbi:SDR family oxidoreductase [Nocardioides carbamazepini]|jgi:NAD(P)-dependent dehydrogenase (short-subunit alcohol dehydrogenase family)|uniref:SDR family NAD(P)-dependent oxidoreductase n=1 Tax=Nocardioides carbamazepini TaxID=2854259 RepID=UPI00214A1FC4|nr:SDR family NAD(P)-dependent oxidoreductase [Nocardioides carbamazepini]MCR1781878.1 SDR family oxidoreductase [Nocardioides carbamazepini]
MSATAARTRRAVVTGGLSGIGAAVVERLRADGCEVLTADIDPAADLVIDVSNGADIERYAAELADIDVLVNSAGIVGPNLPAWEVTPEAWARTIDINLTGSFLMTQAVLGGMRARGWGRVVNIASVAGKEGNPNLAAYSASKAGLIGLTKSLGKELATDGVLVNVVTPAVIATPMNDGTSDETLKYMIDKIPMKRPGTAPEVAALVSWLASDDCSFSTGAVFDASGGRSSY